MAVAKRRAEPEGREAGFFGKVPSEGDFVSNRIDRALRERLDAWLQRAISDSRRQLDEDWDDAFARMPVWRFVLGADVVGGRPVIGVMTASADRVGREFPLVLACRISDYQGPTRALCGCTAWFGAAEALVRSAQNDDFDLDLFDDDVAKLPQAVIAPVERKADAAEDRGRSFWWNEGARDAAGRFAAFGLPAPSEFRRLLASEERAEPPKPAPVAPPPAPKPRPPRDFTFESAVASNPGTRLRVNADAWTSRPDVHAVADGVGDLPSAGDASRLALAKLRGIATADTLDELVRLAKGALGSAHAILRAGAPEEEERPSASVAALFFSGERFATAWAGDARCYLIREGMMRRLTRDHVEVGLKRQLSRSVGGRGPLLLDVASDDLEPDDRFLLCTYPLVAALTDRAIADAIVAAPARKAADALVQDALIAGVAGNVTAMVVHARAA